MTAWTADLPAALHVGVGQVVTLPLAGAMGAGNTWSAWSDGSAVEVEVLVAPPAPQPPQGPPSSSHASETLVLTGAASGHAVVTLRLGRSWEPDDLARHELTVEVS